MAKSSRASSKKANNQRKAANINGPAESARAARLSAKLLEVAKLPKPESSDVNMIAQDDANTDAQRAPEVETAMDVDTKDVSRAKESSKRIEKRRQKKPGHVFQKYSERKAIRKTKPARK